MTKNIHHNHIDAFLDSFNSRARIEHSYVLDMGCGDAYATKIFAERGASVIHAHDPYATPSLLHPTAEFFPNYSELPHKYDIIWLHHVLEHIEDCFDFLRMLHARLTDSGLLWMAVPNMAQHSVYSPGHIHNFQAAQLIEVLRRCGYAVGDISTWVHYGQLRVRVPARGNCQYPRPMATSLEVTGRCPSTAFTTWNW